MCKKWWVARPMPIAYLHREAAECISAESLLDCDCSLIQVLVYNSRSRGWLLEGSK